MPNIPPKANRRWKNSISFPVEGSTRAKAKAVERGHDSAVRGGDIRADRGSLRQERGSYGLRARTGRTRTKAARMPVKMSGDDLPDLVFNRIALSFRDRKTVYRLGNHYHVVHERPL